ncbi:MAG: Spy/CpxP family protein refolding chaperone [Acidobacteriota bacterium]
MKAHTCLATVAMVGAVVTTQAWAQPLGVPPGRWWERPRVAEELGLSGEQTQKLDAITLGHARTMIDLKAAVERAELDLRAAAEVEPFAPRKVREAFGVLQAARTRLENERFEMLLKVREVLSSDQWNRLRELVRRRAGELGGRGEKPAPGPERAPRQWRK